MNNKYITKFIKREAFPHFSVVTPLKWGDSISEETLKTVLECEIPFNWISVESYNNVMENFDEGFRLLKNECELAPFVIKIDNDTEWEEGTLEEMQFALNQSPSNVAYTYCSFKYEGAINSSFPAIDFDEVKLKQGNYISSNSMFKSVVINKIGLVTDDQYVRLLDWAFLLKCLKNGYIGKPCAGFFKANASNNSISARSQEDYNIKKERVLRDFI